MTMDVYWRGKRLRLDPSRSLGKGGEAEVFDIGKGKALKLFKLPDHPDFSGLPMEQRLAEERLRVHQSKLHAFPAGLPSEVVVPEETVTDKSGNLVVGYVMNCVRWAEPLLRYSEAAYRKHGVSQGAVLRLFYQLHACLLGIHKAGVVVGDFNDLNVLVSQSQAWMIDADSYQFGSYLCGLFTDRFVDPMLCDPCTNSPVLTAPYTSDADWYAFNVLLMQSLLLVGPYGGIYKPKDPAARVPHCARPLHRITVFHPEVQYPKPAHPLAILPDDVLHHFCCVFERDLRSVFPERFLTALQFRTCDRCGVEHARARCPVCYPVTLQSARQTIRVHETVSCALVFQTRGTIVWACEDDGRLRVLAYESGQFRRESGTVVAEGVWDPFMRFRIKGDETAVGSKGQVCLGASSSSEFAVPVDANDADLCFDTNGRHLYWVQDGVLYRDEKGVVGSDRMPMRIGDVLANQTRIWVGPAFGLGFYRASDLCVALVFDAERRGVFDSIRLPDLRGHLTASTCVLDGTRAWFFVALRKDGRICHVCVVISRTGVVEAVAEAQAGDGSWLGTLQGKCATHGMLLSATDAGLSRIEVDHGQLRETRAFSECECYVDSGCELLAGRDCLYVVHAKSVHSLKLG